MGKSNQNTSWCRMPYQLMQDDRLTAADALVYATLLDYCTDSFMCSVGKTDLTGSVWRMKSCCKLPSRICHIRKCPKPCEESAFRVSLLC
jgi:hypothetical protein